MIFADSPSASAQGSRPPGPLTPGPLLRAALCSLALFGAVLPAASCRSNKPFTIPGNTPAELRKALELAMRGDVLRKEGKFDAAAEEYKKSINTKNDLGAVWVNYGVCLMELNDFVPAKDAFLRAADLLPSDPTPFENLGTLHHERGYDDKAMEYYELSLKNDSNWLPSLRGVILAAKNLHKSSDEGKEYIDTAIMMEKDPKMLRMMQTERFRVEAALKERKESGG